MSEQNTELYESYPKKPLKIDLPAEEGLAPVRIRTLQFEGGKTVRIVESPLLELLTSRCEKAFFEIGRRLAPAIVAVGDAAVSATGIAGVAESEYRLYKDLPHSDHPTDLDHDYWFYATLPAREVLLCASTPRIGRREIEFDPVTLTAMRAYDLATTAISLGYGAATRNVTGAVGSKLLLNFVGRLAVNTASILKLAKG